MGPPSYMRSFVDRNVVMRRIPVLLVWRSAESRYRLSIWHVWGVTEMHSRFWLEDPKKRGHLEGIELLMRILLKWS